MGFACFCLCLCLCAFAFLTPLRAAETNSLPLRIVAGSYPAYCLAVKAVGNLAPVDLLGGSETGPHGHQLTPGELKKLESADVVVLIGLGLEGWSTRFKSTRAGRERPILVECAAGLGSELIAGDDGHGHGPGDTHSHENTGYNPHIWLDPVLAKHGVKIISQALEKAAPRQSESIRKQRQIGLESLDALHHQLETSAKNFRNRKIVTYHDAFPYFMRRYGLQSAGVIQPQADASPTPRTLARLAKRIRDERIRVVFTEPQFNPAQARRLSTDLGVEMASLDTLETGPLLPHHYDQAMLENARTLERFLK